MYQVLIDHWEPGGSERRMFTTEAEAEAFAERVAQTVMRHKMRRSVWLKRPGDGSVYGRLVYSWANSAYYGVREAERKGCVECHAAAGGDRLDPQERMPQRRVTRTYTTNRQADPTAAYELECGHHTIDL